MSMCKTADSKRHQRSYEVIRHRSFSPIYTGIAAWMLMDTLEFYLGNYTLNMEATITLKEHPRPQEARISL